MKRLALSVGLLLATCDGGTSGFKIPQEKDLKPGGVYIAYNLGCEKGCDQVQKGDLLQKVDGKTVKTSGDVEAANLMDGKPHKLELLASGSLAPKAVTITASPKNNMPPLKDVPPFWTVSAEELNRAPSWARRRMFGHASPMVMLMNVNGGITDGRQLAGKKRLIVYWDWGDRTEEAYAVAFMQVLQKAVGDLNAKNVDVMFVHVVFPGGRKAAMNDSDLRKWADKFAVEVNGQKLPPPPMYRFPNETEFNDARQLGMENAFTVHENLGQSPTIVIQDDRGIVRWHSEGLQTPPSDAPVQQPDQYTIIEGVKFALEKL